MNKEQFWSIVDDIHVSTDSRNQKEIRTALENRLRMLPSVEIVEWYEIFEFYQNAAYRNDLWAAATVMGAHCTDDGFMDFRSWLISQGKEVYFAAMQNPESLAEIDTTGQALNFETYPYAANNAYIHRRAYEDGSLLQLFEQCIDRSVYSTFQQKYDLYAAEEAHELKSHVRSSLSVDIPDRPDISPDWRKKDLAQIMPKLCAKAEAKRQYYAEQAKCFENADRQWSLRDAWLQHFLETLPCSSSEELQVFTHRIATLTADEEVILTAMIGWHDPRTAECVLELLDTSQDYEILTGMGNYVALGRRFLEQETDIPKDLYKSMDLEELGHRYADEHPGVFIGNDYVQYPPIQTQTMGMKLQ